MTNAASIARARKACETPLEPLTKAERDTFLADEALYLLAPMMERAGDPEGAQRQRDWAMATYPARGNA